MIIDTHAHLVDEKYTDVASVVERARNDLVTKIIMPTTSIEELDKAIELAKSYDDLYVLAGIHPEEIDTVKDVKEMVRELKSRIDKNEKIVGVGEIGMDFNWDREKKTKERQMEIFRSQLEMAADLNLPVCIHMRDAQQEVTEVLESLEKIPRGQFHCFAGDKGFLELALHWGFYISFAGNITYKSAGNLRERLKEVPLERLLLETDSPYLAPEPVRGTINEPANVKILARFIAQELNQPIAKISEITQKNTLCLYSLDTL